MCQADVGLTCEYITTYNILSHLILMSTIFQMKKTEAQRGLKTLPRSQK